MRRYLLGVQCLLDIAKHADLPAERWMTSAEERGIDMTDIYISAVSPMILLSALDKAPVSGYIQQLRENVETIVQRFVDRRLIAPVTKEIADRWGKILPQPFTYKDGAGVTHKYTFHEKLVLATALEGIEGRPFVLVDRRQEAHRELNLDLEDPSEGGANDQQP
jgi:predicted nucleic acid-binding protein